MNRRRKLLYCQPSHSQLIVVLGDWGSCKNPGMTASRLVKLRAERCVQQITFWLPVIAIAYAFWRSRPFKFIDFCTNRKSVYDFVSVITSITCDLSSISSRLRDSNCESVTAQGQSSGCSSWKPIGLHDWVLQLCHVFYYFLKMAPLKLFWPLPLKHGFGTVLMSIEQHLQAISCP